MLFFEFLYLKKYFGVYRVMNLLVFLICKKFIYRVLIFDIIKFNLYYMVK